MSLLRLKRSTSSIRCRFKMGLRAGGLLLVLALAACQPVAAPVGISEQALPPMAGEVAGTDAVVPEAEAEAEPEPIVLDIPAPSPAPMPAALANQQSECLRGGGSFMARSGGLFACVSPTRDAGRACRTSADCQGLCLARSQTCAPLTPLFGCNDVLDSRGARQQLCID